MNQKSIENFRKQMEQNTMQGYVERLHNNDAIFDEVRYATGFSELDKALSGGFIAGLHCLYEMSLKRTALSTLGLQIVSDCKLV